jgi:hypothetical protein
VKYPDKEYMSVTEVKRYHNHTPGPEKGQNQAAAKDH